MPLAFPSHQGLILPVARRWPGWFDGLALCVGAAMPDIADGVLGLIHRGHLGQWYGHSLIGVLLLCWPGGLLLTWAIACAHARWLTPDVQWGGRLRRLLATAIGWPAPPVVQLARPRVLRASRMLLWSLSVVVGALSHLLFDCISHEQCLWLYPWRGPDRCFPAGWYRAWFEIPLPLYEDPYPFAPHTVIWCVLSVLGIVLFFWPARRRGVQHATARL